MAADEESVSEMDVELTIPNDSAPEKPDDSQPQENKSEALKEEDEGSKKEKEKQFAAASPHYRVKISGLPRFYTPTDPLLIDFKRLLHDQLGLKFKYIRSPKKGNSWLYITFYDQTHQEKALKLLKQYKWKGRTLICTLVVADVLKRKQEDGGDEQSKKPRLDISIEEQMLMSTIPYHTVSYEEQLSKKNEEAQCLFKWLAVCMEKKIPKLIGYMEQQITKNSRTKLPFKLEQVRASPVIDGYRNKCEFRIGNDPQTNKVVVGYRVDNQEDDIIAVAPPDSLRHLPKEMIDVCKEFEKYVQESEYPAQKANHDSGVWRLLHVRINRAKQLMIVVLINPTMLSEEELAGLKQNLIKFFSEGLGSNHNVISLYIHMDQDLKVNIQGVGEKVKRSQGQMELLWGQSHMEEQLLDLQLEIDPNFYFQSNTWGAEELYKAVVELAGVDADTTVLDLCCGSGGMGMMFAKHCKEVIGVELMDVNVDDAKRLAAKNGLSNCEFLQGAVDDLLPELEEKLKGKKVIPILDPPRVGISKTVIRSIRKSPMINRLIYICSNMRPPVKNLLDLASSESKNGFEDLDPFVVKKLIPIDMSPHALRSDWVILCERLNDEEILKTKMPVAKKKKKSTLYNRNWHYFNNSSTRSNMFPTKEMVGSYSNLRKPKQEIDYMKRDSLYPVPLRGALYQRQLYYSQSSNQHFGLSRSAQFGDYNTELSRYSSFQSDMARALEESCHYSPRKHLTSTKLAYANNLLQEGIRMASEALDGDYWSVPASSGFYDRRTVPNTRYKNGY